MSFAHSLLQSHCFRLNNLDVWVTPFFWWPLQSHYLTPNTMETKFLWSLIMICKCNIFHRHFKVISRFEFLVGHPLIKNASQLFFVSLTKIIKKSTKPHSSLSKRMGCDAYHAFSTSNQKSGQKLHSQLKYLGI